MFEEGDWVDVVGTSKGKGFQGVMKRHNFSGLCASHGAGPAHRMPGGTGMGTSPGRLFKNTKLPGQMGAQQNVSKNIKKMPSEAWIPQIRASKFSKGEAYVVVNNYRQFDFIPYLYRTRDFGKTWENILFISEEIGVVDLEFAPDNPDIIYANFFVLLGYRRIISLRSPINVNKKLDGYAKKVLKLKADYLNLDKKQLSRLRAYKINSKALGRVESGLDAIISKLATCERLVPLYKRDFEANKTNAVWLKRAVSRMFNKGCQSDPLYETLAKAYAEAAPSPDSKTFYAGILEKNGDANGAAAMRKEAFDLETDPLKKAKYKLKFAQAAKVRGQLSKARSLAREAIGFNPNFGKAYLFIASLYASSANKCGKDEFEKRMTYVAALNKAIKAAALDPSANAGKYIRSYRGNIPNQKVIFSAGVTPGSSYTVKCWIGETVRVPSK